MRSFQRQGMLLTTLLAFGVMPPLPRKEVDLGEVEAVTRDLQAAGIDVLEVVNITGPEDFVAKGRLMLQAHEQAKATGEIVTDARLLLSVVSLSTPLGMPRERFVGVGHHPNMIKTESGWHVEERPQPSGLPSRAAEVKDHVDRDRQQQRQAKKSRNRVKSRRGF